MKISLSKSLIVVTTIFAVAAPVALAAHLVEGTKKADNLSCTSNRDDIYAKGGNDVIHCAAADGNIDKIYCGNGNDRVTLPTRSRDSARDETYGCETVKYR